jgi:hypothetical protein
MSEPPPPAAPPVVDRFQAMNVGTGLTDAEVLEKESKGEFNLNRTLMLRIQDEYWTSVQVYKFAVWLSGVFCMIIALINWEDFSFPFLILGIGASVFQAFFPHAIKHCNNDAQFRPGEGCMHATDCSQAPERQITKNECQVQVGSWYKMVRAVQGMVLVLGIILVVVNETAVSKLSATNSFVVGFGAMYTIAYSFK